MFFFSKFFKKIFCPRKFELSMRDTGFSIFNLVFSHRFPEALHLFLLLWFYCTLTVRESILIVNGSRIRGWWVMHHYISVRFGTIFIFNFYNIFNKGISGGCAYHMADGLGRVRRQSWPLRLVLAPRLTGSGKLGSSCPKAQFYPLY